VGCDGSTLFGNLRDGIELRAASGQEVGVTVPGAGNIIAGNGMVGVAVTNFCNSSGDSNPNLGKNI
jgi:hypothetical protein